MPSHYLNQFWPDSLKHICGTRGKWVNQNKANGFIDYFCKLCYIILYYIVLYYIISHIILYHIISPNNSTSYMFYHVLVYRTIYDMIPCVYSSWVCPAWLCDIQVVVTQHHNRFPMDSCRKTRTNMSGQSVTYLVQNTSRIASYLTSSKSSYLENISSDLIWPKR